MGDGNAKVGESNMQVMGNQGCGSLNDNGERLSDICLDNSRFIIGGMKL